MIPDCGLSVHRVSEYCAASVSFIANIGLILLIMIRTSKEMRVYSKVLLANCIIDLFFTSTSFIVDAVR
ncbi:hypothetical protein AAVH_11129 [Aphelenchoides avenae]|nr:hypothetical protein AAVH_11128 [Aphelenchus avenae]KAH7721385.1 hypothetical protein AAVH_11129 [Aphelenchus avenae]